VQQVAEVAGNYRLIVQAKQKDTPAGRYETMVIELRTATEKDYALQQARKLYAEFRRLYLAKKYDEAQPLAERAIEIRKKALGLEHLDIATSLNGLAFLYRDKGDRAKAESLYQQALAIREKAFGPEHLSVADSLNTLAVFYRSGEDLTKAESLYLRALAITEKTFGPEHPEVADYLNSLATLYHSKGNFEKAEPLYQRALVINEKALGPEHLEIAKYLSNIAVLYRAKGEYSKAEPLYRRALATFEKALGPEHPDVASLLNNIAVFYRAKGDYPKAEPLHQRALAIREKVLGKEHPDVASSLNNLAMLYAEKGDSAEAESLYQRALEIRKKAVGPEHPAIAESLNNLANLYNGKGDYEGAESLHQRALVIFEKAYGPEHPRVAASLHNLAAIYREKGDYAKSEALYQRTLDIRRKMLGPEHLDFADSLNNLAALYRTRGEYLRAEPLYHQALVIWERALGPEHPNVAHCLNNLSRLYTAKGEVAQAVNFQSRAFALSEHHIAINLATGSERQKLAYLATLSAQGEQALSLQAHTTPNDLTARGLAAAIILQRKGRVLEAMSDNFAALRSRFNAKDQALLDQFKDASAHLARLVLNGPQRMSPADHQKQIKDLEDQKEKLEAEISHRSDEFRAQSQPVTLETIRAAIPDNAALIEFAAYRPFNAKAAKDDQAYGEPRYVAYILRQLGEIQWKELGEAKVIDSAIDALRKALRDRERQDVKHLARAVDEKVMQPLRPLLGDTTHLLVSPDGTLNLIPFAALVDEQGRYMVERYSINYLTSGRDLLRLQVARESRSDPLVVAAPAFGEPEVARAGEADAPKSRPQARAGTRQGVTTATDLSSVYFPPLGGAAEEARAIKLRFPKATVLTGARATETSLKQAAAPQILHVSTHGFFLEDQPMKIEGTRGDGDLRAIIANVKIENPLLRSGLALAGANLRKSEGDDGVLTAMEAAGLNLWGTKLVVLSACDTGVGEVKTGEGVYGLRRALVLAGAETQVMSLWPVSDYVTRELMATYYDGLKRGLGRGEALRQAQLKMLRRANRHHPFYWASFIQSGEWANLAGKR
jgi:CHAT domain-containing protein/Tfp pilus assembly protein PilF